jgi:predicted transposase YdaD
MRFLTEINETTEKVPQELLDNALIREAVEYAERAAYTKEELEAYDKLKIDILTVRSMFVDARTEGLREGLMEGLQEGMAKGMEKGVQEGMAKGMQEGMAKGMIEGKTERNIEIAKQAKMMKMPISDIAKLTGLSETEIDKL